MDKPAPLVASRRVPAARGSDWWSDGWRLFKAAPGTWIAMIAAWVVINFALLAAGVTGNVIATVATPIFAAGILLGARDQDGGKPLRFESLFAGFGGGRLLPLLSLGLLNLLLSLLVMAVVAAVALWFVDTDTLMQLLSPDLDTMEDMDLFAMLPMLLICIPLMAVGLLMVGIGMWFAPGLVAVQKVGPWTAMKLSFAVTFTNVGALVLYDIILLCFALVATIPFGLGWIVLAPTLAASWYASWRDLFGDAPT